MTGGPERPTKPSPAASKRGRRSRIRGHDAERKLAGYLRANGWEHAHTTRAQLGHDGHRAPGDIADGPAGWTIEAKDVAGSAWPTWQRQAAIEAAGGRWVVVRRLRGNPDVGAWLCRWSLGDDPDAVYAATFGEFVSIVVPFYATR